MAKKRERLDLMYDILLVVRQNRGKIGPTRLLYASNLSSLMFKEYMSELLEKQFILEIDTKGKKTYELTDKGNEFINKYKEIKSVIENFGL